MKFSWSNLGLIHRSKLLTTTLRLLLASLVDPWYSVGPILNFGEGSRTKRENGGVTTENRHLWYGP